MRVLVANSKTADVQRFEDVCAMSIQQGELPGYPAGQLVLVGNGMAFVERIPREQWDRVLFIRQNGESS